jgi:hypothetical protein
MSTPIESPTPPRPNMRSVRSSGNAFPVWEAANAVSCALTLIVLWSGTAALVRLAQRDTVAANWLAEHQYEAENALSFLRALLWIGAAYFFSRVRSVQRFAERCGVDRMPTIRGWLYAWIAITISLLLHLASARGWTSGSSAPGYASQGGSTYEFYVIFVSLIAPFYEEVTTKGFLYAALRTSQSRLVSTILVVSLQAHFHWYAMTHSAATPICLTGLWVLICVAREQTSSVWDCVICHSAYNASQLFGWPVYVLGMAMILPVCRGASVPLVRTNGVSH